jgi:hypothetical protein
VIQGVRTKLSVILTRIMDQVRRGAKFQSRSTVTALRLDGAEAVVWVNNESTGAGSGVLSANRDLWTRTEQGWRLRESTLIATRPLTPPDVLSEIRQRSGLPAWNDVRILLWHGAEAPGIPGFVAVALDIDPRHAARTAVAYLREHAPEEAGPAELAFLSNDSSRVAAVTRVFDARRAETSEWAVARQAAVIVHQSLTMRDRPDEAAAAQVIWLASEAYRNERIVVTGASAGADAFVRARYGKLAYSVGVLPRELLGGEFFVDSASVPSDSALGRWLAAQKLPYDGVVGR